MAGIGRYPNAALAIDWGAQELPNGTLVEELAFATPDRAATTGVLYRPPGRSSALVALMHPRVDFTRHYLIPALLRAGHAVWAQRSRNVNNDLTTVHEQLLLDVATAHSELARRGFEHVILLGNSGGSSLYAFYLQQAALQPEDRLTTTPSGLPVDLTVPMAMPAGLILLAPHPGQGELLLHCIDPAVADENDPGSVIPELDLFADVNGFRDPPTSSRYDESFLARYREGQRQRVLRIDARMHELLASQAAQRRRGREENDPLARRRALAGTFVAVHRTDADPRTVDLSLDPSARDYGSIFGRRPDVTNFGAVGFARLTTPNAWLSTWSGISSRASLRLTAPDITVPTLLLSYTADNSVFPGDVRAIKQALASADISSADVVADHYGFTPGTMERVTDAADTICAWLETHG